MQKDVKAIIVLLIIALFVPTLVQWAVTPPNTKWVGYDITGTDYYTYLAKMTAGQQGKWLYSNLLTSEDTEPVPIYTFYLALGHLSRLLKVDVAFMFHSARIIMGILAIIILALALKAEGWLAIYLAVTASGVGVSFQRGFFMTGHLYLCALQNPHYMLTIAGMVMILKGFNLVEDGRIGIAAIAAALGTIMVSVNLPFLMLVVNLTVLVYGAIYAKKARLSVLYTAWTSLCALPIMAPMGLAFLKIEWLKLWRAQAVTPAPRAMNLVIAFGIASILVLWQLPRGKGRSGLWCSWIVVSLVLCFSGWFQNAHEYLIGMSVPVGALAAAPLKSVLKRITWWLRPGLVAIASAEFVIVASMLWVSSFFPQEAIGYRYLPNDYVTAVSSLRELARAGDIVITQLEPGNMLPYLTGGHVRPYLAHQSETLNFRVKAAALQLYYEGGMTEEEKAAFYKDSGATWVITDYYLANKFAYVLPGQRPWRIASENSTDLVTVRRIIP